MAFRQKVQPLNQTHNDCIQQFTKIIMGLLTGSDGETAFQGPGSDALAELIGKFFEGEQQLAGTDPLTLEGRLLDAAVICEQHAHNLQATVKSFSASRGNGNSSMFATISALLDGGDNPGDEGPDDPDDIAIGELYEYQADMQAPINELLPATPDINALPANVPPNPSLGDNAGFIQSLGINEPGVEGLPPGSWEEILHDNDPLSFTTPDTPREFTSSSGLGVNLYPNGEMEISWIDNLKQLLDLPSLVNWLGDGVQTIKAYVTDGLFEKYFSTDALTEQTMQRLNALAARMGFKGVVEKIAGRLWIIFTRIK